MVDVRNLQVKAAGVSQLSGHTLDRQRDTGSSEYRFRYHDERHEHEPYGQEHHKNSLGGGERQFFA